ncbi:MAG: hypothetical protein JXR11_02600 [Balneola sp.]
MTKTELENIRMVEQELLKDVENYKKEREAFYKKERQKKVFVRPEPDNAKDRQKIIREDEKKIEKEVKEAKQRIGDNVFEKGYDVAKQRMRELEQAEKAKNEFNKQSREKN